MPVEKPHIPPERKPVSEFRTPSPAVVFYTELVNRTDPAYVQNAPVARGTIYSSIVNGNQEVAATYPNLYFLRERKFGQSDQLVFWDWSTDEQAESTYNAEVNYIANAVAYPAFTRVYTPRRDVYEDSPTIAIGSTLTALLGVNITDGGQNYTFATGTIDGTDVQIEFVVSKGVIVSGVVTNEGTGVLSTDTIIITGDGNLAVAVPIVQPTTCYLTSQKKQELPQDDPLHNEFVRVIRVYETLPGPFIATTRVDDDGKIVTINTRRNIAANIVSQETLIAGVWCKTNKKGDDNFAAEEVVECREIPGNYIPSTRFRSDGSTIQVSKRLQDTTAIVPGGNLAGGFLTLIRKGEVSDLVSWEIREISEVPGPTIHGQHVDDKYGIVIDIEKTIVPDGTNGGVIAGAYVEIREQNKWQSVQISSKLDPSSLPEDVQWFGSQLHSFPPELITGWPANPYGAVIQFADATCGCQEKFASVLQANFNQYTGEVKARYTEQFYNGTPPDDVTITQFFPQAHVFGFAFAAVCGCGSDTTSRITAVAPQYRIPLCLHDDVTLCVGGVLCVGAPFSWTFAATSPAALPHGSYIMLKPYIERWRFGVFRRVLTEILVP